MTQQRSLGDHTLQFRRIRHCHHHLIIIHSINVTTTTRVHHFRFLTHSGVTTHRCLPSHFICLVRWRIVVRHPCVIAAASTTTRHHHSRLTIHLVTTSLHHPSTRTIT